MPFIRYTTNSNQHKQRHFSKNSCQLLGSSTQSKNIFARTRCPYRSTPPYRHPFHRGTPAVGKFPSSPVHLRPKLPRYGLAYRHDSAGLGHGRVHLTLPAFGGKRKTQQCREGVWREKKTKAAQGRTCVCQRVATYMRGTMNRNEGKRGAFTGSSAAPQQTGRRAWGIFLECGLCLARVPLLLS